MSWLRPLRPFNEDRGDLSTQLAGWVGNTLVNAGAAVVGGLAVAGTIFGVMKSAGYQRPARLMIEAIPLTIAAAGGAVIISVAAITALFLGAVVKGFSNR